MSVETQEYVNGMRPGPLTREIPECMRDKYTVVQAIIDIIMFVIVGIGYVIKAVYLSIVGRPKKDLKGAIAVVTGGGGGLGSLIALRLARLGCTVVLWDINKQVILFNFQVNLLINNAGVVSGSYLLDTPDHLIQRTFDVNILAHFWTAKAFLPAMMEHNNGHIVTIASMAGHVGVAKLVDYCSSKAAACGFDEALRLELETQGYTGVKTSLICPYFIRSTGMFEEVNSRFVPQLNSNDVADRVVMAIRTDEPFALIPGFFRVLLPFKLLVPWPCMSELIRRLVPDAAPVPVHPARPATDAKVPSKTVQLEAKHGAPGPMTVMPPARHDRQV
ncbi:retinol dehydrogenase 10-B [Spodoptera frugiperda]|uniref:Retinol dehydrogenase 10-B n=1 Tax=Spodoptera frugiperda TaxID=7108 RepID=A0A9R0DM95_SPOFR|nr:retinol dehydrogenase 10-B [Spodoptera frugiperda]